MTDGREATEETTGRGMKVGLWREATGVAIDGLGRETTGREPDNETVEG